MVSEEDTHCFLNKPRRNNKEENTFQCLMTDLKFRYRLQPPTFLLISKSSQFVQIFLLHLIFKRVSQLLTKKNQPIWIFFKQRSERFSKNASVFPIRKQKTVNCLVKVTGFKQISLHNVQLVIFKYKAGNKKKFQSFNFWETHKNLPMRCGGLEPWGIGIGTGFFFFKLHWFLY